MSLFLVLIVSLVVFVLVCILVVWLPSLRYSAAIRTLEAACGLVAALAGCLVLAFILFGLVYQSVAIGPSALIALGILLLGLIGVAVSAVVHSRTGGSGWRIVLWVTTAVVVILTFLTLFSIGLFLLPSTLFALLASALSLGGRRRSAVR